MAADIIAFKGAPGLDRETFDKRLGAAILKVYETRAIVSTARMAVGEFNQGDGSDADLALRVAQRLLSELANALDQVVMLAPAAAQEVAHA